MGKMEDISYHEILFAEESALRLGEAHCYIVIADRMLTRLQYKKEEPSSAEFQFEDVRLTPFGKATVENFTRWWLSNNMEKIGRLEKRLDDLLPLLVKLKRGSAKLEETFHGTEYGNLITRLAQFAREHSDEMEAFCEFVVWLYQSSDLAPAMFFTHPPWSTTQLSDRLMPVSKAPPKRDETKKSTEIVFGLRTRYEPTLYRVRSQLYEELADAYDPEQMQTLALSAGQLFSRASRKVLKEFGLYFEKTRICGEKIKSELDSLLKGEILKNEQFLGLFIEKARQHQRTETVLWDFKKSIPAWHRPTDPRLKVDFANDIASFANASGGLIVVGIDDDRCIVGVLETERRVEQTRSLLDRYLGAFSRSIEILSLPLESELGRTVTSLIIIVPQGKGAVSVKNLNGSFFYPRRTDTGVQYLSRDEILQLKKSIHNDNLFFANDVFRFVFYGSLIGKT